jgi:PmbA protein
VNVPDAMEKIASLARAANCDTFDIVAYDSFSESVEVFEKKISNTEIQRSAALGIRVFRDARPGIAFTEKLAPEALKICLDDALSHTHLTDPVPFSVADNIPASSENFDHVSPDFDRTPFSELARFAVDLEDKARAIDKRVENVPYTGAARSSSRGYFLNSKGVSYSHADQDFSAYSAAVAALGDQKKMGFYSNSRLKFADLETLRIAERAVERTVEQLGAKPVASGEYRILFSNRVSGQIISMYGSPFFAELAIRGQSRLKGKLGEMIASPMLSIRSMAHRKDLKGSRARDGEGVPTRDLAVVENGKFVQFLYNLEAAAMDKTQPTGNSVRSVASKAGTGFKNLVVDAGTVTQKEMLAQGKVLMIDKLEGAAGCSPISGELSIGAQGFLYENGERVQAVDRITLSSNFFEMIKNIEAVSSEYSDQYSSVRVPDLLIGKIAVAG